MSSESVVGLPGLDEPQSLGCFVTWLWRKGGVCCKEGWLKTPSDSLKLFADAGAGGALPCPAG